MKIKAIALAGAALFLATAAYASQPASSLAERAQTKSLNEQSLQAAQKGQDFTTTADSASANPAATPSPQTADNNMSTPQPMGQPLATLTSVSPAINTANVVDSSGNPVGAVRKVIMTEDGHALRVDVALAGQQDHVVAIRASKLTYDRINNVLTSRDSADQIKAMPLVPNKS
ncbi:MAG TPA: hypothetical protein VIJ72_07085 [Rhizomicrobium sp.]